MMRTISLAVAIAVTLAVMPPVASAATPEAVDVTGNFSASGAGVERLQAYEIAGILILRGRAADASQAAALGAYAKSLGYERVANLVQIVEDRDVEIARAAEVELSVNRSLDGCRFHVTSDGGIVRVAGSVRHELQKDVAVQVLRNIDGVRAVEIRLDRF